MCVKGAPGHLQAIRTIEFVCACIPKRYCSTHLSLLPIVQKLPSLKSLIFPRSWGIGLIEQIMRANFGDKAVLEFTNLDVVTVLRR